MPNQIAQDEFDYQSKLALSVLKQFMTEMMHWEQQCHEDYKRLNLTKADLNVKLKKDLDLMNEIFSKYCTPRKRAENHVGAYSEPTEYNPDVEKLVDVVFEKKNRMIVYTEKEIGTRIKFKYRYTLIRKDDRWLIDSKQWFGLNNKWEKAIL